jgi:hypothetical protein
MNRFRLIRQRWGLLLLASALAVYLFSPATEAKWFYFLHWLKDPKGGWHTLRLLWLLGTAALISVLWNRPRLNRPLSAAVLVFSVGWVVCTFLSFTKGAALYRDDHPSFMFRLWQLSRTFPSLLNYSPYWNGGVTDMTAVTTGTSGIGLLLWPLLRLFPTHQVYTPGIAVVFAVLVPACAWLALRILGADRTAANVAGALALGVSQHFFLWLLNYGTIGASLSSAMMLPISACLFRAVRLKRREPWLGAALVFFALLALAWPPAALMGAAFVLPLVLHARHWTRRTLLFLGACTLVIVLAYLPYLRLILGTSESPLSFAMGSQAETPHAPELPGIAQMLSRGEHVLLAHLVEFNPLLLFFGLGVAIVAPVRALRAWYVPAMIVLALITAWGRDVLPEMQLSRFAIPLAFTAVAPASVAISRAMRRRGRVWALLQAAVLSLLVVTAVNVGRIYQKRGRVHYSILNDYMSGFAEWVGRNVPEGGRVLFAGPAVHGYGMGHVAYLPVLANREMMACDYYHFPPRMVEYQYPPSAYAHNPDQTVLFMNLYNVTHAVTFQEPWKHFFQAHPGLFTPVLETNDWLVVGVKGDPGLFFHGCGEVRATFNRIDVSLEDPDAEAVIKYNWNPGLRTDSPAAIYPHPAADGITLIGIRPNGARNIVIRFRQVAP